MWRQAFFGTEILAYDKRTEETINLFPLICYSSTKHLNHSVQDWTQQACRIWENDSASILNFLVKIDVKLVMSCLHYLIV